MFTDNALVPANVLTHMSQWLIADVRVDESANHGNGELIITFANNYRLRLLDAGQDCCENRYLGTDDDLTGLVGSRLVSIKVVQTLDGTYGDDCHEQAFVKIQSDRFAITLVTHNEHNGYYGGFCLRAQLDDPIGAKVFIVNIP